MNENKKVTGIGEIFFKSKDPEKMKEWYSGNLGLVTNEYGSLFEFRQQIILTRKVIYNGVRFQKRLNILSLLKKNI